RGKSTPARTTSTSVRRTARNVTGRRLRISGLSRSITGRRCAVQLVMVAISGFCGGLAERESGSIGHLLDRADPCGSSSGGPFDRFSPLTLQRSFLAPFAGTPPHSLAARECGVYALDSHQVFTR